MGKIIQLDDALSNKIAAGEVVERPASVVKELVENAIDAGSKTINIQIEEAGLTSIRISDNGEGIEESDVKLAFGRHATSKIKNEYDLFRIRTLGFRGEALPSIASVSKLELVTSTGNGGTRILLEGGTITEFEKTARSKGTDITITDLFFNTPARLKYMKSVHTELGNITDVANRLALSHPEISFRLYHNNRKLLYTTGNGDIKQVLAAIYGINIAKKMIPIKASSLDFEIQGYISLPEITRASRNYISTILNGRFIKNYSLIKAIQEGYHTLLPIGRFPIVLLNITMDPILVDVNVHPSKLEVRISKEQELNELVIETVKAVFKTQQLIPAGLTHTRANQHNSKQTEMELDHLNFELQDRIKESNFQQDFTTTYKVEPISANQIELDKRNKIVEQITNSLSLDENEISSVENNIETVRVSQPTNAVDLPNEQNKTTPLIDESNKLEEIKVNNSRIPPLYPIGQMHGTYIFAQNDSGLYIIDQHAAQERIKYEFYKEKVGMVSSELQELLVPLTFEYSTDESIKINEHKKVLEKVGVFLEPFGFNSFIIKAHPQWFPKGEETEIIKDMIEQVLLMKKVDIHKLREEAAIMMSCKGSIKANRFLRNDEIQALIDELRKTSDPFTCPHGRPIIIHTSVYELEKMFKRIM